MDLEFLHTLDVQILGAVAVAVVAVVVGAVFLFSSKKPKVCLDPGKFQAHISCRGKDSQGEEVIKPYTPTTLDSDVGKFELVIKMYPQGRMSHHFRELQVGDYLAVKGPKGRFRYQPGQVRVFGMIAGGSGITPMFQVARAILENPNDKTKVHLIYANVSYEDILLRCHLFGAITSHKEELETLAERYSSHFNVYYVLNQVSCLSYAK
ncbi:hypothetical protein OIU76_016459 [Salix suchowensis]|nr:hypothetical protein OIU76_016459 [Salix suchowensis]